VQQKIYQKEEHGISLHQIDSDALMVMDRLRNAGYIAYLVGGSVRDLLLRKKPKDFDISTSAEPHEIKQLFRNCILIGKRFRLAHIRFGKKILEVSTFRSGDIEKEALIVRDNEWGTPQQDVFRRDFTINGLFYDSSNESVIDYVGGYQDLQKKYLRTIGAPYVRFKQDPVRMIRLLKFRARFGFEIDEEAKIALLDCRHEILKSSPARILEEFLRMLEIGAAEPFCRLLAEYTFFELLMPGLAHFLEHASGEEVYAFLQEADLIVNETPSTLIPRPVLLCCLCFTFLQLHLKDRYLDRNRHAHLGNIQEEAQLLVDEIFRPFLLLPRRLKTSVIMILTSQYRLTPLEKKRYHRLRVPFDPDFPLALEFLKLRCRIEPSLQIIWEEWSQAMDSIETPFPRPRRKRRKRKSPPKP